MDRMCIGDRRLNVGHDAPPVALDVVGHPEHRHGAGQLAARLVLPVWEAGIIVTILDDNRAGRGLLHQVVICLHVRAGAAAWIVEFHTGEVVLNQGADVTAERQRPVVLQLAVL